MPAENFCCLSVVQATNTGKRQLGRLVGYKKHGKQDGIMYPTLLELLSISFLDSDYAKCEEARRCISGWVNKLGGMLTKMTSKKQGSITLSSTEAELVAGTECANEAMFQSMLLEELLCRKVQAPNYVDNTRSNLPGQEPQCWFKDKAHSSTTSLHESTARKRRCKG
jgi:hypothetical protein